MVIDTALCRAVIFDMDGVVTDSVPAHRQAWQGDVRRVPRRDRLGWARFDPVTDYLTYIDGKRRYDGVRDFLASPGIKLPFGSAEDPPDAMRRGEPKERAVPRVGGSADGRC